MFLPIGDEPSPGIRPYVNYGLIAVNFLVFLLVTLPAGTGIIDPADPMLRQYLEMLRAAGFTGEIPVTPYDLVVFKWGFRPAEASLVTLFTSMFMHGGAMHLAGNMLFLWIYGDNVEDRLGRLGYLLAYLAAGIAATLFHAAFNRTSGIPMVGASGAISGVLGFYFLFFPRNRIRMAIMLMPIFVGVRYVPARLVLGAYLVLDNLVPFFTAQSSGSGVAHGAHIGGFIAGLGAAYAIDWRERSVRSGGKALGKPRRREDSASPDAVASLLAGGRHAEAAQAYFSASDSEQRKVPAVASLQLARWLAEAGHPTAALGLFRRVISGRQIASVAAEAHVGVGLIQLNALGQPTAAWQHFLDAIDLDPTSQAAETARVHLRAIEALRAGGGGRRSRD